MTTIEQFLSEIANGSFLSLARALTIVENELNGSNELLRNLKFYKDAPVIGITGPPGAGKSTLVNALLSEWILAKKKIAVLAVDPTSPFNFGSLLGDRIRMSAHFNSPDIFIRSIASRGSVGGLSSKIIEMVDVLRASVFDYIIIETVGVGQSELDIAGLADKTIVVLVPESGDEIQHIKSGLMEIANAFVVNKADRENADSFANNLVKILHHRPELIPVMKTVANQSVGLGEVINWINSDFRINNRSSFLYAEKAFRLIQNYRVRDISKDTLLEKVKAACIEPGFNIYKFVDTYLDASRTN
jgi:LAO/AO transport system kinase